MKLFRAVPWILVLAILRVLYKHYSDIDKEDRRKAHRAVRRTKGKLHQLTEEERQHLLQIAKNVNHKKLVYDLTTTAVPIPTPNLFDDKKKLRKRSK